MSYRWKQPAETRYLAGDELLCDHCDRVLYRLTRDAATGDTAEATMFEQVDAVWPPAGGHAPPRRARARLRRDPRGCASPAALALLGAALVTEHEKTRLARGVELEKRRYIGFARTPVIDTKSHLPNVPRPDAGDPLQAPGRIFSPRERPYITAKDGR